MPAHTPGPWRWERDHDNESHVIRMASAIECRYLYKSLHLLTYDHGVCDDDSDFAEAEANASLIAAAPEMFAELRAARDLLAASGDTRVWPVLDRIRDLIDRIDPLH